MSGSDRKSAEQGALRRSRRRRSRTAAHVLIACGLAVSVYVLALVLAHVFDRHIDISGSGRFDLSPRTVDLFARSEGKLVMAAFFERGHPLYHPLHLQPGRLT